MPHPVEVCGSTDFTDRSSSMVRFAVRAGGVKISLTSLTGLAVEASSCLSAATGGQAYRPRGGGH